MPSITDLKEELNDMTMLKFISSAFTETSSAKIQNIRSSFEKNKDFWNEISHVYHLVKISAIKQKKLDKNKKSSSDEGKTLSIALTSNQRFYGSINTNIMRKFISEIKKMKTDIMVIGRTGIEYMKSARLGRAYKTTMFAKEKPDQQEIHQFLENTQEYEKIFVYYPKFATLLSQTVGIIDITQTAVPDETEQEDEVHLIFEPELFVMLEFFEHQVRTLLFLRVMLETDLSRTAARLISMSTAEERADSMIKEKKIHLRKAITSQANTRLLETLSRIKKWKT